jgi:hypothetical protein
MRSGHCYLAAYPTWRDPDASTLCPYCEEDEETFSHAILHCQAKFMKRLSLLSGIDDIGPDAPLWSSVDLIKKFAAYISATSTGFPPAMPRVRHCTASPDYE